MPVGTHGAVRGQQFSTLSELGYSLLLANTYHLLLRPGVEFLQNQNGLRNFTGWKGGFLTDSGGFQIFSLPKSRTITDDAAIFRSYIDGTQIVLTPERCIEAQQSIQSDIMMVLDECVPSTSDFQTALSAVKRSTAWAKRSFDARGESSQGLFGIVQGALFPELRQMSAAELTEIPFDGFAIGGLAVGEGKNDREEMTALAASLLPEAKPRYLMGVGTPLDILEAVHRGVDMFDCVLPTLLGQQGVAFVSSGKIDLRRGEWKDSKDPISPDCSCIACKNYTRGYLHQLCKTYDASVEVLVGLHNLTLYARFMERIRTAIKLGIFLEFYKKTRSELMNSRYEIVERSDENGSLFASVRHRASGEVMHSAQDPWRESQRLYIEQSALARRMGEGPLVIWDVGLGAATNAMGAVLCYEELSKSVNPLHPAEIYSFENDLEPLLIAMGQKTSFPHLDHQAPEMIYKQSEWQNGGLHWKLLKGDFEMTYARAPAPDIIFFDPFSYKVNGPLWSEAFFRRLFQVVSQKACVAFTFTASTAVRSALMAAGFFVARGWSTGQKKETTVFMTPKAAAVERYPLLDATWLARWERSHVKDATDQDLIIKHPQFAL